MKNMYAGCRDDSIFVVPRNRYTNKKDKFVIKNTCFFLAGLQSAFFDPKY